jgi:hypothetical protein
MLCQLVITGIFKGLSAFIFIIILQNLDNHLPVNMANITKTLIKVTGILKGLIGFMFICSFKILVTIY